MNLTNITNIGGLYGAAKYGADATGGLLFGIILIAIWIIIVINTRHAGIEKAVASTSFACLLISVFLVYMSLLNILYPIFFALFMAGALFYIKFKDR